MRLTAKLSPTQTVTPQMITTVTILQYGAQELWDYLSELSYENPMVELHQPKEPAKGSDFAEKLQWLKNSDRQNRNYYTEDLQTVQNVAAPTAAGSLEAYLLEQLMLLKQITINQTYLRLLRSTQDPEVQHYLREKYAQAEQAVRNLQNRSSTMLRCAQVIARIQDRYFHGGSLCKMTLRDVAEEMGVHESTVSRTVRDKYIQCDQGLFPMHYFFSRSAGQNGNLSRENVKAALAKLLAGEDPARPMSDEQLVAQLSAQHITISRRAVAKYRAELGIPAAYVRKTDKQK